jgi:exopolysaccharide biosynthesis polyprenyl glycosylphosphotransferase
MKKYPFHYVLLLGDLMAVALAFRIAFWLRYALEGFIAALGKPNFASLWPAVILAFGTWILLFRAFRLDRPYVLGWDYPLAVSRLLTAVLALMVTLLAGSYMARIYYSRLMLIFLLPLLVVFLVGTRLAYQALMYWLRKYGVGVRRVVIVGQSDLARELGDRIRQHQELNYELLGFLYPTASRSAERGGSIGWGGSEQMACELANKKVDEMIFAIPIRRDTAILEFIASCQKLGIQVKLIPEYYDLHTKRIEGFSIDGIPIFELRETSLDPFSRMLKLLMDYSTAVTLLLVLSPVIVLISVVLAVVGKGHILKREARIGLGGRPFMMCRFDVSLAEARQSAGVRDWKVQFCEFLHRYSLSELPQLWNIIKGEMSVVGPRPETPERVRHYSAWHRRRLEVKPGITGLAQVWGLRGTDSSDLKTKYDLEYVATFSPLLDLTLIVATINTLFRRRKAAVPARDPIPPPPREGTVRAKVT